MKTQSEPPWATSIDIFRTMNEKELKDEESYCDCVNEDCDVIILIMIPEEPCPKCGTPVEPSQVDPW